MQKDEHAVLMHTTQADPTFEMMNYVKRQRRQGQSAREALLELLVQHGLLVKFLGPAATYVCNLARKTCTPRKSIWRKTLICRPPLKHDSDQRETLPERVSDDPRQLISFSPETFFFQ